MSNVEKIYNLVIVDDHFLVADSLQVLIDFFSGYKVLYHTKNGKELQQKMKYEKIIPDVILLDVNMPIMNGYETMEWLKGNFPAIKVLVLSMDDEESVILKMLQKGANGYLLKDIHPEKLKAALNEVMEKGYYHSDRVAATLLHSLNSETKKEVEDLKENELTFLQYACSEMTYKEIADKMNLSPKTIDGYRNDLFRKFDIKNRVGLVIYALKNKIFKI